MLIVQNNEGTVVGANSYMNLVSACGALASRVDLGLFTDEQVSDAIIAGTVLADSKFYYNGNKFSGESQSTQFPRDDSGIPSKVIQAVIEYTVYYLTETVSMISSTPEEYVGDKYAVIQNPVTDFVHAYEAQIADGRKYLAMAEKFLYDSGWLQLIV